MIPAYFSFITGYSADELTRDSKETRKKVHVTKKPIHLLGGFIIVMAFFSCAGNTFDYRQI
ncbi:MAG: hypothetical protein QNK40_02390 [Desulfobacterales bacterium]|nr:hypothetical protein [Desulfobacterales bacterium]